jgi:hypothetical protein
LKSIIIAERQRTSLIIDIIGREFNIN